MITTENEQSQIIDEIKQANHLVRGIAVLRMWLRLHGYEELADPNHMAMKNTTLLDQRKVVETIRSTRNSHLARQHLISWLIRFGYENSTACEHELIVRKTGNCHTCGVSIAKPIVKTSDEAVEALRAKLLTPEELAQRELIRRQERHAAEMEIPIVEGLTHEAVEGTFDQHF